MLRFDYFCFFQYIMTGISVFLQLTAHGILQVSAALSVNAAGSKIIARETTLMPNIRGLPALMCLLFAPSIQLR